MTFDVKATKLEATQTSRIGSREFREKLSTILDTADGPVAITRHGDTVGYYIPARSPRSENEKEALTLAVARLHEVLAAKGITAEEIMEEFQRVQAEQGKVGSQATAHGT